MIHFMISFFFSGLMIGYLHLSKDMKMRHRIEDVFTYMLAAPLLFLLLIGLSKSPELLPICMIPLYFFIPRLSVKKWLRTKLVDLLSEKETSNEQTI